MSRTLLVGGCVLSLDRKVGNFRRADVLIDDDRIAEVGENIRARDAEVIDATDTIVMPGFVDTHRHLWESLFRGNGSSVPTAVSDSTAEDVYASTLVGLLGGAEAGITTVVDWSELSTRPHTEAALQAHADAGLRTVYVDVSPDWRAGSRSIESTSSLITFAAGPARPEDWSAARELGLRIHAHAGTGTDQPNIGEMAPMLGEDVTLVHCCDFGDADIDAVAASGAPDRPHAVERNGFRPAALADPEARRSRYPAWAGGRYGTNGTGRHLRPDAGSHLPSARHSLRLEARRQGRRAQAAQHS